MPIIVKDFTWKQTDNFITINVPLRGIHPSKVDIFHSERYIKANFEQFFFEVLLSHSIDVNESKCTLTPIEMVFELYKVGNMMWDSLEVDLSKKAKMELKLSLLRAEYENIRTKNQKIEDKKCELKRTAVSEQMKIEAKIKEDIEVIKKKEQTEALGNLKEWQHNLNIKTNKTLRKNKKKFEKYLTHRSSELPLRESLLINEQFEIPSTRVTREIEIDFTPRQFPTPLRESKTEEENEWLRKQAEARRSVGFVSEDIRPEEKNPQFLLKKGDDFMKNNNFLGALSAYTFGIQLSKNFVDLYIARSRAHFAQGNFHKAILDCSTALELMDTKVEANLKQRAECIGRRGMALCKLKMLSKGINEIEESLKLDSNEELENFFKKAEEEWMNTDSD